MHLARTLLATVLIAGCATLPDVHPWFESSGEKTPTVVGAHGPLNPAQTAAVLARLQAKDGVPDVFARHLAIEEEVAGEPLTVGNMANLLRDGPASYAAMFDSIARARDHVNVEFYIIEDDDVGRRFSDALLRKSAEGLSVNLMYDSVGCIGTPAEFFERLREGGVRVLEYNPVNPLKARRAWRVNNRDHRKVVITDGRVAYTGGINISHVYSSGSAPSGGALGSAGGSGSEGSSALRLGSASRGTRQIGWRDTNVQIEGPAVEQIQRLYLDTWTSQGGEPLPQRNWFPALEPLGEHPVRVIASGPESPVPAVYVALISAILHAERSVHITMAYFVPDAQTLSALKGAAARGVDVTLVLPSYTDFWAVFHAGRSHYSELLASGVKIYERQEALLHAKTVVIDGVWSTVGSSNLDWRSFLHNEELNAVILGWDFGKQMEAMFDADIGGSVRVDPEVWAHRPMNVRMKEWIGRAFEYWL
jgi:cardiolipin synthase